AILLDSFSDTAGWGSSIYTSTIQLADVNGDGAKDVCGRGPDGAVCALMTPAANAGQNCGAPAGQPCTCAGPWKYKLATGAVSTVKTTTDCPATVPAKPNLPMRCYVDVYQETVTSSTPQRGMW